MIWVEDLEMCVFIFGSAFSKLKTKKKSKWVHPCSDRFRVIRSCELVAARGRYRRSQGAPAVRCGTRCGSRKVFRSPTFAVAASELRRVRRRQCLPMPKTCSTEKLENACTKTCTNIHNQTPSHYTSNCFVFSCCVLHLCVRTWVLHVFEFLFAILFFNFVFAMLSFLSFVFVFVFSICFINFPTTEKRTHARFLYSDLGPKSTCPTFATIYSCLSMEVSFAKKKKKKRDKGN